MKLLLVNYQLHVFLNRLCSWPVHLLIWTEKLFFPSCLGVSYKPGWAKGPLLSQTTFYAVLQWHSSWFTLVQEVNQSSPSLDWDEIWIYRIGFQSCLDDLHAEFSLFWKWASESLQWLWKSQPWGTNLGEFVGWLAHSPIYQPTFRWILHKCFRSNATVHLYCLFHTRVSKSFTNII